MKLNCDEALSNFAFKFNLRHYNKGTGWMSSLGGGFLAKMFGSGDKRPRCPPSGGNPSNLAGKRVDTEEAGAYTRPLLSSTSALSVG